MSKGNRSVYFFVILLIYASGSIYFISFHYNTYIPIVFVLSFAFWIFANQRFLISLRRKQVNTFLALLISLILVLILNFFSGIFTTMAIMLQVSIGLFISQSIERKIFMRTYVNVMIVFSVISLIGLGIQLVKPEIALVFPRTEGDATRNYYNAIVYVFQEIKGLQGLYIFNRNSGIFWEPGSYQAFLNLALLFLLNEESFGENQKDMWKCFILLITILSTFSVTGYTAMLFLIYLYFQRLKRVFNKYFLLTVFLFSISMIFVSFSNIKGVNISYMIDRYLHSFGAEKGFLKRLDLDDIRFLYQNPLNILGMSYDRYLNLVDGASNSIISTLLAMGIFFTSILLWLYYRFSKSFEKWWGVMTLLIMFFVSESLLWRPLFMTIAWYGLKDEKGSILGSTLRSDLYKF